MAAFRQQLSGERRVEYFRGVDAGRHEKLQLGPGIVEDFDRRRFQSLTQRRQPGGEHGEAVEGQRDIPPRQTYGADHVPARVGTGRLKPDADHLLAACFVHT